MPMTPGNKLYLYRLLRDAMGVGRQTMISRVEEVLMADDLMPSDVGCADTRELLEQLDFVRLTVFKRGRVYATVIAQPELDELLERASTKDDKDAKMPATSGKRRSWKRKKSAKDVRPAKPRPKGRVKPDAKKAEAETESQATAAKPELGPEATDSQGAVTEPEAVAATETVVSPGAVVEPGAVASTEAPDEPQAGPSSPALAPTLNAPTESEVVTNRQATSAISSASGSDAASGTMVSSAEETVSVIELQVTYDPGQPTTRPAETQQLKSEVSLRQTFEAQATLTSEQQVTPMPATQPVPAPTSEDISIPQPASTITSESVSVFAPESQRRSIPHQAPSRPIPHSFFREVWCPSDVLGTLYEVLPLDVNPLSLLDEDWTVARATNSFEQTAHGVAYSLRCLSSSGGLPIRAHLHRQGPTASGKHWQLARLEGISQDAFVDLDGLPANDEGAWVELDGMPTGAYRPTSPLREFSQFAIIGSWAETLPELEQLAEPEPWGPGLENLREYFLVTFHRAKSQGRIGVSANKRHAAFDTGLLTRDAQPIFACFDARDGNIAWQLVSFSTTTRLEKDPEPATYVSSLSHLCLVAPHAVRLSRPVRKTYGEALDTPIARAMLKAQRNHRVATPAYDPQTEELRLLLPLASREPSTIDRAVVLADLGDGDYEARAVLSLDRARVCARVVTSDLPAWLR